VKRLIHISRKKILSQIVIGNIVIAISTIGAIGIIATYTSKQHINKEFVNGNMAQMEYNIAQMENELNRIIKIPFTLNNQNQNIRQLFELSYSGDVLELSTRFSEFVGLYADYTNVDSIWIYDGNRTVIDTKSGVKNISNFDGWKKITDLCQQAASNYMYMRPYISEMNKINDYNNVISIVSPLNMNDSTYNSGCVIINMNMQNVIDSVSGIGKGNFFVINSKSGTEITIRKQNLFSGEDIRRIMNIKDDENIKIGRDKFHVCLRKSSIVPNYVYVLAVPYSIVSDEINEMYLKFSLAVLFLMLIEMIIIIIISTYIYQPIKTTFSNVNLIFSKEIESKTKATVDELALINAYMSNLQEKLNNKSEKLVEYSSVIKQNVGQKIIDGDLNDESEIKNSLEECGVIFNFGIYTICIFMIDNWNDIVKRGKGESDAAKNAFFTVMESIFCDEFNCIYNIPQNDRVTFIIESGSDDVESRIDNAFNTVNDILRLQINETVSMARISDITPITAISGSYTSLLELAQERFNYGRRANIKTATDKIDRKEAQKCYQTFINSIMKTISNRDMESASEAIHVFADNIKHMYSEYVKTIILNFAYSIKNEYRDIETADYIQNNVDDIVKYSTADDLKVQLIEMVSNIILSMPENTNDNITSKIKEYIDNNLSADLSLVALGDVFKLNPSYLSTLFKGAHGIGVVDYINKSRIEEAKHLLRNTSMSIKDISDEVGFMNYNSFARVFKKYVGVSAKDFKNETNSMLSSDDQEK